MRATSRQTLAALAAAALIGSLPQSAAAGLIAFERGGFVWIAQEDGTGARPVVRGVEPALSPDGTRIAYTVTSRPGKPERTWGIALFDIGSGARQDLPTTGDDSSSASFSPDGSRLVMSDFDGDWRIAVVEADGSGFRHVEIKDTEIGCYAPAWAADGDSFFCTGVHEIHRIDLQGRTLWSASLEELGIASVLGLRERVVPSPDGASVVLEVPTGDELDVPHHDYSTALFYVDLAARTSRRVTPAGVAAWGPAWIGASELAFVRQREGEKRPAIVAMPLAGGDPRPLAADASWPSLSR